MRTETWWVSVTIALSMVAGCTADVDSDPLEMAGETAACTNTCGTAGDGECDDGGPGAAYGICELGTDCDDCGPRDNGSPDGDVVTDLSTTSTDMGPCVWTGPIESMRPLLVDARGLRLVWDGSSVSRVDCASGAVTWLADLPAVEGDPRALTRLTDGWMLTFYQDGVVDGMSAGAAGAVWLDEDFAETARQEFHWPDPTAEVGINSYFVNPGTDDGWAVWSRDTFEGDTGEPPHWLAADGTLEPFTEAENEDVLVAAPTRDRLFVVRSTPGTDADGNEISTIELVRIDEGTSSRVLASRTVLQEPVVDNNLVALNPLGIGAVRSPSGELYLLWSEAEVLSGLPLAVEFVPVVLDTDGHEVFRGDPIVLRPSLGIATNLDERGVAWSPGQALLVQFTHQGSGGTLEGVPGLTSWGDRMAGDPVLTINVRWASDGRVNTGAIISGGGGAMDEQGRFFRKSDGALRAYDENLDEIGASGMPGGACTEPYHDEGYTDIQLQSYCQAAYAYTCQGNDEGVELSCASLIGFMEADRCPYCR